MTTTAVQTASDGQGEYRNDKMWYDYQWLQMN